MTATKEWMPVNLDPSLKEAVTLQLWRKIAGGQDELVATGEVDGEVDDPCSATGCEETPWTYTWYDMPTHDENGYEYSYWVDEEAVPANFVKSLSGMTVTNTYQSPTTNRTGTKVWMPVDLLEEWKVTVWFQLWRYIGSNPAGVVAVGGPVAITAAPWTYTWTDMPTHDENGYEYIYYVTEVDADGNDWTPPNFAKEENGMTVTNTFVQPTADLTATKIWMPANLLDEWKVTVWFQLWRYIGSDPASAVVVGDPVAINAPWTYTWADMPTHDANGNAYTYFVTEVDADGNDWTPPNFEKEEDGMTITNTFVSPTDDLVGTKVWMPDGLLDSMKFDVEFQLYRYTTDPDTPEAVGDPVTLSAPDWSYTWADMPTHDENGNEYTYYVIELTALPPGYTKTEEGMSVINEYEGIQDKVIAQKVWVNGPTPRPTVWFQLWRTWEDKGTTYREPVPEANIKELPDGVTMVVWENINMDTITGIPYTFYVKEVDENGFDFTPEHYTKLEEGLKVTNSYVIPAEAVTAKKIWVDGPTTRPTVWFQLYRHIEGGTPEIVPGTEILKLDNGATEVTWTGVEMTDINGNPYIFTVKEVDADGNDFAPVNYIKIEEGLVVTNCYHSPKFNVTMTKIWVGGPEPRPNIRIQLYRNGEPYGDPVRLYYPETTFTWWDLDKTDPDGVEYRYTVDELTLPAGYSKSVDGLTITNTFTDVPYTGDANSALLYGVLALSSLMGFGAIVVGKRRKKK